MFLTRAAWCACGSASDDMTIKLWDWDKNWDCTQVGRRRPLPHNQPCYTRSASEPAARWIEPQHSRSRGRMD